MAVREICIVVHENNMINKKASITEFMVLLIMIVLTSATVLFLVKSGIVSVRADAEEVSVLNTEFIPVGREGYLAIKEFQFCSDVDELYNCIGEKYIFTIGEEVHFRFVVESSTSNGEVMLVENYRLKSPRGEVLLDVNEESNYHLNLQTGKKQELITFKDYFIVNPGSDEGEYTLELVMENVLLNKRATITKTVRVGEIR